MLITGGSLAGGLEAGGLVPLPEVAGTRTMHWVLMPPASTVRYTLWKVPLVFTLVTLPVSLTVI